MAEFVDGVIDVLANLEVPFAAARELVIERVRHLRQLGLRNKFVGDPAQVPDGAMVEEVPHALTCANSPQFFAQSDVVRKVLLELIPLGIPMRAIHRPLRNGVSFRLVHQIRDPGCDWLNQHLCAFALQEVEHVEVAVTLGDLRPELAGDLHHRLHAGAVHFD